MIEIRDPVTHNLKILPEHYSAVCAGVKRAELRKNDRDYRAGDILDLCEWDKDDESFTGEFISVTVTHVADVSEWMPGYVLLSIERELRERAEPVSAESYPDDSDLSFAIDLNEESEDFQTAQWLKELRRRRTAPPAPVVPECIERLLRHAHGLTLGTDWNAGTAAKFHRDPLIQAVKDCRAMLKQQPLSVEMLAGALRNAPLAPADNQGRKRPIDKSDENE